MKGKSKIALKTCLVLLGAGGIATGVVAYNAYVVSDPVTVTESNVLNTSSTSDSIFADNVQDGQILQCFCWSYKEIMNYLPKIASQGFTAIQTSPIQVCKEQTVDDGDGNARIAKDMWWAYYQPAAFTVDDTGDNALGTPDEFAQMCDMAHQYGVKVLVDVVANHLGNQWVADSLCERAYYYEWEIAGMSASYEDGGYIPYTGKYWAYGSNSAVEAGAANASTTPEIDTYYYKDTMKFHPYSIQDNDQAGNITQGNIGMMDLDTSTEVVQDAVADYLEELIDYGVDGFRFDAAKHIETPYDEISSNFWPTVMGRAQSAAAAKGKEIYAYGEILNRQGIGRSLSWYTNCGVNITDSGMGHNIVENGGSGFSSFNYADGENYGDYRQNMVCWAESHDNYMGTQDTHNKSETVINKAYAILGARKDFATLYCARFKDYATSTLGSVATENGWSYDEIGAVNKFHNYFAKKDADENCYMDNNYTCIERYNDGSSDNGIVIVGDSGRASVSCSKLSNGTYTDQVTGNTFTVSGGYITGDIGEAGIAVIYNAIPDYSPSIKTSLDSGNIKTDTLNVVYTLKNSQSAILTVNGKSTTVTSNTATVNVTDLAVGDTVTVQIIVTGTDGTVITKSYTYTRVDKLPTVNVYFENNKNWSQVNAYIWNSSTQTAASSWPGTALTTTAKDEDGNTCYVASVDLETYDHIIFNNGTDQTVDISVTEANKEYALSGDPSNNKYSVTSSTFVAYTNPDDPVETTTTTTPTTTTTYSESTTIDVDFANDKSWSNVYAYVWNSTSKKSAAAWPGTKLNAAGTDTNGNTAYTVTVDISAYDMIIFSNGNSGNGNQTEDLTLTATTTGFTFSGAAYDFAEYVEPTPTTTITTTATTTTGSDDETTITVDFANDADWNEVYVYMWKNSTQTAAAAWPGTKLTTVGKDTNGHYAYSVDVDLNSYDRIIFNNGSGTQTKDLTLTASTTGFTVSGAAYTFEEYVAPATEITVYFENTQNWSTVKAYIWNDSTKTNAAAWPGTAMTYVGKNSSGNSVYSITVDTAAYDRIIFTNGSGAQTVDLTVTASTTGFTVSGSQNNKLTCTSYKYSA